MAVFQRIAFLLLVMLCVLPVPVGSAEFGLVGISQQQPEAGRQAPTTDQCVNLSYMFWGEPLQLFPYTNETVGIVLTENNVGDGLTLGLLVVPTHCQGTQPSDLSPSQLTQAVATQPLGVPGLPGLV